jgi:hypothetical protein
MKFMRRAAKRIGMDHERKKFVLRELKMELMCDKMLEYKTIRIQVVVTMQRHGLPRLLKEATSRMDRGTGEAV